MKTCPTYYANIYCGVRPSYNKCPEYILKSKIRYAKELCQKYCDSAGLGLTFTETEFIYTDGNEPGFIVGLINYPRFPSDVMSIHVKANNIARMLMDSLNQERVSIMYPDETVMLEKSDL